MCSTTIPNPPIARMLGRLLRPGLPSACLLLALGPLVCAGQTQLLPPPPPPPPPPQQAPPPAVVTRVTAAKTIFLSNAGANDSFNNEIPGGPNVSYNELYAALQQWGYFQLVDSPSKADLIFQIRGMETAPNLVQTPDNQHIIAQQHTPELVFSIIDPHADPSAAIDTIITRAGRAANIPKGTIAFAQSVEWLTYQISTRVSVPHASTGELMSRDTLRLSFETLIHSEGPVPPQVLSAKKIYVQNDSRPTHYFRDFTSSITAWGYYHLVDSAQSADVVFHYNDDDANGTSITLTDPATKAILWTITDPHFGFYRQSGKRRAIALNQNLISLLKQLNHIPLSQDETSTLH